VGKAGEKTRMGSASICDPLSWRSGEMLLPRLCPSWQGDAALSATCAIVKMEALKQLWTQPLDIMDASGNVIMRAAVLSSGPSSSSLEVSVEGLDHGPHAVVQGLGRGSGLVMDVFGHGVSQPYFSLVSQTGGGSRLLKEGYLAMLLQAGFAADHRVMVLNADGEFLASGGRYLGVRRGAEEVWKLRLCPGVDSLVVVASMQATILTSLPVAAAERSLDVQDSTAEEASHGTCTEGAQAC